MRYVEPEFATRSFNCPTCGAHASQKWFHVYSELVADDSNPYLLTSGMINGYKKVNYYSKGKSIPDEELKILDFQLKQISLRLPILSERSKGGIYCDFNVDNLFLSKCFACKSVAVWCGRDLVLPRVIKNIDMPEDLPAEVSPIFQEATAVLDISPRCSAALLRLCIEKICRILLKDDPAYTDKTDLNAMIGILERKGLSSRIIDALDIVRVIGNDAVHEGTIDLNDDKVTAVQLFKIISLIVDQLITQPRRENELYGILPEGKRAGIAQRKSKNQKPAVAPEPSDDQQSLAPENSG